jgi:AcrR family transcriptional regulator
VSTPSPKVKGFQVSGRVPSGKPPVTPVRLADLMANVGPDVGARRKASQLRSHEKMAAVLAATADLLDELGPEAVTTTAVAARAGVSVGWLYNYFDDRQRLLEEIVVDGLQTLDLRLDQAGFSLSGPDWRSAVVGGLELVIEFFDASPGFRSLWFSSEFSGRMTQANRLHDDGLAAYLADTVTGTRPGAPEVPLRVITQTFVGMIDKGLDLAYRNSPSGDAAMLAELKRASVEYLAGFLD